MPDVEIRHACPVCLGVKLGKLTLPAKPELVLDWCQRCGGIWFDEGEVRRLRDLHPKALWAKVALGDGAFHMKCHNCHAAMGRNDPRCGACGWVNEIECPTCGQRLEVVEQGGLRLDICRRCRGAWFDNLELSRVWNRAVDAVARRRGGRAPSQVESAWFFLPDLIWLPIPIPGGAGGWGGSPSTGGGPAMDLPIGDVADGGGLLSSVGDALGSAAEWTADLAGDVFGGIADAFDGIDF